MKIGVVVDRGSGCADVGVDAEHNVLGVSG